VDAARFIDVAFLLEFAVSVAAIPVRPVLMFALVRAVRLGLVP